MLQLYKTMVLRWPAVSKCVPHYIFIHCERKDVIWKCVTKIRDYLNIVFFSLVSIMLIRSCIV